MIMQRRFKVLLLLVTLLTLSACGFALRGSGPQSGLPFKTIYLNFPESSSLGLELKRYIRATDNTKVVADRKDAEAILEVLGEARNKTILTLNTQGRVREYSLTYQLSFQVRNSKEVILLPPTEILLRRDISFNEAQVIAKEKEEEMLTCKATWSSKSCAAWQR